jgi:hypothetical protein
MIMNTELQYEIEKAILRVLKEYNPTPAEGVEDIMNATLCILNALGTAIGEDGYKFAKDIFTDTLKQL